MAEEDSSKSSALSRQYLAKLGIKLVCFAYRDVQARLLS